MLLRAFLLLQTDGSAPLF